MAEDVKNKNYMLAFAQAMKLNHIDILSVLISHININARYSTKKINKATFLIESVKNCSKEVIKFLINNTNINVNIQDDSGNTAIIYAIKDNSKKNDNIDIIELLLEKGANVLIRNFENKSALNYAIERNKENIALLLLTKGHDVNSNELLTYNDALIEAIKHNQNMIVKFLIENGTNVNTKYHEETALMCASKAHNMEFIKLLLFQNANVNIIDQTGKSALIYAIENIYGKYNIESIYNIIELLLDRDAEIDIVDNNGVTPLIYSIKAGNIEIVKLLLDKGANPNVCGKNEDTPLIYAVKTGNIEIVKLLIDKDAKPNVCGKDGIFPLFYAIHEQYEDIVQLLINNNANVDFCDKKSRTALIYAAQWDLDSCIIKALMEKTSEEYIDICDLDGHNILDYIRSRYSNKKGYTELCELYNKKFKKLEKIKMYRELRKAVQDGDEAKVKEYIEVGADVNFCIKDNGISYPIIAEALKTNNINIVKLFIDNGAQYNKLLDSLWRRSIPEIQELLKQQWNMDIPVEKTTPTIISLNKETPCNLGFGRPDVYSVGNGAKGLEIDVDDKW